MVGLKNRGIAEYYQSSFSDQLTSSLDRSEGHFDNQYYYEMYKEAEDTYDEAITNFEQAQHAGDRADRLQLVVLIFAVGLALAAYGSLLKDESIWRVVFAIGSILSLTFGSILYFGAWASSFLTVPIDHSCPYFQDNSRLSPKNDRISLWAALFYQQSSYESSTIRL